MITLCVEEDSIIFFVIMFHEYCKAINFECPFPATGSTDKEIEGRWRNTVIVVVGSTSDSLIVLFTLAA